MIFSKYGFSEGLIIPESFQRQKTSTLLSNGLVVQMVYPGIPVYTPIGLHVLRQIESAFTRRFAAAGFHLVGLSHLMQSIDLEQGEELGEQFSSKFMNLKDEMSGYHLMCTPEMLFVRMFLHTTLSYTQLPIRYCYNADFFRQVSSPRPILRGRQFRIFGIFSLEIDAKGVEETINLSQSLTLEEILRLGLPHHVVNSCNGKGFEVFYPCNEGDYQLPIGTIKNEDRENQPYAIRALSLGLAYPYGQTAQLPIRYRTAANRNTRPRLATYGLCTNRLLFSIFDHARDAHGFKLPAEVRPFDICIVPNTAVQRDKAKTIADGIRQQGFQVAFDDRYKRSSENRAAFGFYLGAPVTIIVDAVGIELRQRGSRKGIFYSDIGQVILLSLERLNSDCQPSGLT